MAFLNDEKEDWKRRLKKIEKEDEFEFEMILECDYLKWGQFDI